MIIAFQIVAIVFALIMVYFAYLHYSRGELNGREIIVWYVIWIVTIFIIIFPQILSSFAKTFAISRIFDMMVVGGFILVISITYLTYVKTKSLERKIEKYVRKETLLNIKDKKTDVRRK